MRKRVIVLTFVSLSVCQSVSNSVSQSFIQQWFSKTVALQPLKVIQNECIGSFKSLKCATFLRIFSRKSKLNLDRANAACMCYCPSYIQSHNQFSPPIVADFCPHLFLKSVSFCVSVDAYAAYPFVLLLNCKFQLRVLVGVLT